MFGFSRGQALTLEKPNDIYTVFHELDKKKADPSTRLVINELCTNVFQHREKAKLYFKNTIIHLMIDKQSLSDEKLYELKMSLMMIESLNDVIDKVKLTKGENEYGGFGLKMIVNAGYKLAYKDSDKYFSVIAYKP